MSGKKIVRVPYTVALEVLAPTHLGPPKLAKELPSGTRILAVHDNYQCRALDFTIQNEEFQPVEPGIMLPVHETDWIRPGNLLMLRNEGKQPTEPGRVVVLRRSTLEELGAIITTGITGAACFFQPKEAAARTTAAELAELARHVAQFDRVQAELVAAKKRADAAEKEVKP